MIWIRIFSPGKFLCRPSGLMKYYLWRLSLLSLNTRASKMLIPIIFILFLKKPESSGRQEVSQEPRNNSSGILSNRSLLLKITCLSLWPVSQNKLWPWLIHLIILQIIISSFINMHWRNADLMWFLQAVFCLHLKW